MDDFWREFGKELRASPEGDFFADVYSWAAANPGEAVGTILALIAAPFVAFVFLRKHFFPKPIEFSDEPLSGGDRITALDAGAVNTGSGTLVTGGQSGNVTVNQFTESNYEAQLRARLDRITDELLTEKDENKVLLAEKAEIESRLADIGPAFEQAKERIAELEALLKREGNQIGAERLARAEAALASGDFEQADAILADISADADLAVQRKARALFVRGGLADIELRWADAAAYYGRAADLDPTIEHLAASVDMHNNVGNFAEALHLGEKYVARSKRDFLEGSTEIAAALSDHAVTLNTIGRNDEAEALYRQALAIHEANDADPEHHATVLNNLANLLVDRGGHEDALPLYLQAVKVERHNRLTDRPGHGQLLSNVAGMFIGAGMYAEAEEVLTDAMERTRAHFGSAHPSYLTDLVMLAQIRLGTGDPGAARELLDAAVPGLRATHGDHHPLSRTAARQMQALLREHFPEDPTLAELEATFGPEIDKEG